MPGLGKTSKDYDQIKQKSIYKFTQTCTCGHKWGTILVEFQPGETTRTIELTCPDCGNKRKLTATRNP